MDRREFSRVEVGAQGAFYLRDDGKLIYEFTGIVDNVSEGGLGVLVENEIYEKVCSYLEIGQRFSFQAYDDKGYNMNEEEGSFYGEATVVRKTVANDTIMVGCKIDNTCEDFRKYVEGKKVYLYLKSIRTND